MARFYSAQWIHEFNDAVAELDTGPATAEATSLLAASGRFSVTQLISESPEGPLQVTLEVQDGHCALRLGDTPSPPNVTVSISYEDAAALSRGDLDAATALGSGRIGVKGDLSVLIAAQALFASAAGRLGELQAATTY